MGDFVEKENLYMSVVSNAISSALRDQRRVRRALEEDEKRCDPCSDDLTFTNDLVNVVGKQTIPG